MHIGEKETAIILFLQDAHIYDWSHNKKPKTQLVNSAK